MRELSRLWLRCNACPWTGPALLRDSMRIWLDDLACDGSAAQSARRAEYDPKLSGVPANSTRALKTTTSKRYKIAAPCQGRHRDARPCIVQPYYAAQKRAAVSPALIEVRSARPRRRPLGRRRRKDVRVRPLSRPIAHTELRTCRMSQ